MDELRSRGVPIEVPTGAPLEALARPPIPRPLGERVRDWVEWFGVARLVLISVSIALVGAGGYWLVAPPPPPVEASLPMTAGASTTLPADTGAASTVAVATPAGSAAAVAGVASDGAATTADTVPADIVVHVAGAVLAPGVHRVPSTARVADAVAAAGGPTADAHTDAINLAAPLADGDRVYVPTVADGVAVPAGVTGAAPAVAGGAATGAAPSGPVPINTATAEQLDALPGVGPSTAAAIVAHREQHGPFTSIDGLADVRGIGPAKLDAIRPLVTL